LLRLLGGIGLPKAQAMPEINAPCFFKPSCFLLINL